MDRRSWLWRRKSSEKSPNGETDSSESVSSHSERVSDEQALSVHNNYSPEVTSKPTPTYDELLTNVKTLSSKLSEALQNIDVKEEYVKQHAKVAEEAVSGWEKAETEAVLLKNQLDKATEKNSALEERVCQLDGALKECLRQLRQGREDQEQKIHEVIAQKKCIWEFEKVELENQIIELQSLLETTKTDHITSTFPGLCIKLEAFERENSEFRVQLLSRDLELKRMTSERDLSILAAETASKQYLESIKKVAKLEAECRKLNMLAQKAALIKDYRPSTGSSYSKSQSDFEGSINFGPTVEINLMDDFLEMEKFAAEDNDKLSRDEFSKAKIESLINRNAELEEELKKTEAENVGLRMDLINGQDQLKASRDQLESTLVNLIELQNQLVLTNEARNVAETELKKSTEDLEASNEKLVKSVKCLEEAEVELVELKTRCFNLNAAKCDIETELESMKINKEVVEARLESLELENRSLQIKIRNLEVDIQKGRNLLLEAVTKCEKLNDEISSMKAESEVHKTSIWFNQDKELANAASKFADCRKTIDSLDRQLKSLAILEDVLNDSEMSQAIIV